MPIEDPVQAWFFDNRPSKCEATSAKETSHCEQSFALWSFRARRDFDDDQPRDEAGRWTAGGSSTGGTHTITDHARVQKAAQGIFGREITQQDVKNWTQVHDLVPGAHTIEYHVKPHGVDGLHYEAKVKNEKGETLLHVRRQIEVTQGAYKKNGQWDGSIRTVEAHHDLMTVHPSLQGQGIGTQLFDRQLRQYQAEGKVQTITTDAAWVGMHQWPRLGFSLREPGELEGHKREMASFLQRHGVSGVSLDKAKSIHDLSVMVTKEPVKIGGVETRAVGKAYLIDRGKQEGASLIGLKFDVGPKSKELKVYEKTRARK